MRTIHAPLSSRSNTALYVFLIAAIPFLDMARDHVQWLGACRAGDPVRHGAEPWSRIAHNESLRPSRAGAPACSPGGEVFASTPVLSQVTSTLDTLAKLL